MSKLETLAKPLLVPMARGESLVLAESEQKVLALWAIKTALLSGQYRGRNIYPSDTGVGGQAPGFLCAFSLGQVVFQAGMWEDPTRGFEVESEFLVQLWPYASPIKWPLARTFPLEAFPELTDGHFPEAAAD